MDKNQLVTIVVTAATTTVIIGAVKWIGSILEALIPISKTSEKVKAILTAKTNRNIFWVVVGIIFMVSQIVRFCLDKSPVTRLSIVWGLFYASLYLSAISYSSSNLA